MFQMYFKSIMFRTFPISCRKIILVLDVLQINNVQNNSSFKAKQPLVLDVLQINNVQNNREIPNAPKLVLDVLQINNVQNFSSCGSFTCKFQMYFKSIMFRTAIAFIPASPGFQMYFKSIMFRTEQDKKKAEQKFQMYFKSIMFRTRLCVC